MTNLPNIHLQAHIKQFSNTDVDYFGPIQDKICRKIRKNQGTPKYMEFFSYVLKQEPFILSFPVTR